jgi:hypothetical protein
MHQLNALLAELSESLVILVLLYELTIEFFCALFAPAQCPLGRALQNSSEILPSFELTTEFFCALLALAQCPPGRDL